MLERRQRVVAVEMSGATERGVQSFVTQARSYGYIRLIGILIVLR